MPFGKRTETVEEERGRHPTAVREREYVEPTHAARNEVDAEEQVTTTTPSAWSVARGWIGVLAAWIAIALAVVEVVLGFRLGFLLASANPNNGWRLPRSERHGLALRTHAHGLPSDDGHVPPRLSRSSCRKA